MANVRRPIHLQLRAEMLRPTGRVASNGASSPLGTPLAGATMNVPPSNGHDELLGATNATTTNHHHHRPASTPTIPIRPNALMNFPSTRLIASGRHSSDAFASASQQTAPLNSKQRHHGARPFVPPPPPPPPPHSLQHQNQRQHQHPNQSAKTTTTTTTTTQVISGPISAGVGAQQSPKALSPSGGLNESLPSQILPHLFVGNQEQTNRETVSKLNIRYILSLGLLPQLLQSQNCALSVSPSSPSKIASSVAPATVASGTGAIIAGKQAAAATVTLPTNTNTANSHQLVSHHHHHHQHHPHSHHHILMPNRDESRDFKIKLRPNTPTSMSQPVPSGTANGNQVSQQLQHNRINHQDARLGQPQPDNLTTSGVVVSASVAATAAPTVKDNHKNDNDDDDDDDDENKAVKQVRSIHCKCINIADNSSQSLMKFFDEAFAFIEEARRKKCNILIHCLAGISRSPTIAIAYLMRLKSLHWQEAYDLVKQCRPQIDPNLNFMGQLGIYNESLRNERQQRLVEERAISHHQLKHH